MRLLLVAAVFAICILCSRAAIDFAGSAISASSGSAPSQLPARPGPDIGKSGSDFLEVCSSVGSEGNDRNAPAGRDATCLGWVEGFADGFKVYEELLNVPRKDRMACLPREVTTTQIVHVIKKYLAENPAKAHRPTRYVASLALAGAFPCK